jgi:hypothetical protein
MGLIHVLIACDLAATIPLAASAVHSTPTEAASYYYRALPVPAHAARAKKIVLGCSCGQRRGAHAALTYEIFLIAVSTLVLFFR